MKMERDQALTKTWIEFYHANYEWDDLENHGGGSPAKAKAKCKKLLKRVHASHGKEISEQMRRWAENAYEREYYHRGKTQNRLIYDLPACIDERVIYKELGWQSPEAKTRQQTREKTLESILKRLHKLPQASLDGVLAHIKQEVLKDQLS